MKKKARLIKRIVIITIVLAAVGFGLFLFLRPKPPAVVFQRTSPLVVSDLQNTVDVTGTVESAGKASVYGTLSHPVLEIAVEVGDTVSEGDLLCSLDASSLELDIQSRQATINSSAKTNDLSLIQAQNDLYYAEWYLENEENEEILAAESALAAAERGVTSAQYSLRSAENTLDSARSDNREARDSDLDPVHDASSINRYKDSVSQAYLDLETAEIKVEEAKQKLERAKQDVERNITALKDKVASAEIATDQTTEYIALNKLKDDLDKCSVTAPISGTVTAVYAKEGSDGRGMLFVIENTGDLIIKTTVKEFDINTVKPGQKVLVKSDATGDTVYEGELVSIAPASLKTADGDTVTGSTAEFEAEVKVTSTDHLLRIGMNVRLNIVTEENKGVMSVPYDSVVTGPQGEDVVYVARQQADGSWLAEMVPVETGMETDLYLEISSPVLKEGDLILLDATGLYDGMPVTLMPDGLGGSGGGVGGPGGPRGGMMIGVGG